MRPAFDKLAMSDAGLDDDVWQPHSFQQVILTISSLSSEGDLHS